MNKIKAGFFMEQKEINKMHLVRLGVVLNNLAILGFAYMLLNALMPIFSFLYFVAVGIVLILAIFPWIFSGFQLDLGKIAEWFKPEFTTQVLQYLYTGLPYVFGVSAVCAVASAVIMLLDKSQKHTGRIVIAALTVVIGIAALIMKAAGVTT